MANDKSSKDIQALYIPVVKVEIPKKDTEPKSDNVSIATSESPATIAGLAAGNIKEYKDLNFVKPRLLPKSIKFCDWYKNDALDKMYTYANKEKESESTAPRRPSNFGISLLYSPSPNKFVKIVKAVP